jgi:hypothetical protein
MLSIGNQAEARFPGIRSVEEDVIMNQLAGRRALPVLRETAVAL